MESICCENLDTHHLKGGLATIVGSLCCRQGVSVGVTRQLGPGAEVATKALRSW